MASDLSAHPSQHEVAHESVELLRAQIREIEDKRHDELKRLEAARKDKEELEQILRVLQTLVGYEREATVKMEAILRETRDALGVPEETGRPTPEMVYDPSRSSSSGTSSVLEFSLVYNPNAALKVPLEAPLVSPPSLLPGADDQAIAVSPLPPTPAKPASKPKRSPGWKSKITSILIGTNDPNCANPSPSSSHSHNSATLFFDDASPRGAKPKRAAKPQKRPSQDSGNQGTASWRRTVGSAGSKFANRANLDINRKKARDIASALQS